MVLSSLVLPLTCLLLKPPNLQHITSSSFSKTLLAFEKGEFVDRNRILVDAYLVVDPQTGERLYATVDLDSTGKKIEDTPLWPALIEKAVAVNLGGDFGKLNWGEGSKFYMEMMSGQLPDMYDFPDDILDFEEFLNNEEFFNNNKQYPLTLTARKDLPRRNRFELVASHVYSLKSFNQNENEIELVNPWGIKHPRLINLDELEIAFDHATILNSQQEEE